MSSSNAQPGSSNSVRMSALTQQEIIMAQVFNGVPVPEKGNAITFADGAFKVPDAPVIPYIEGDGTGRDIWKASQRVFDAAVEKTFGGQRRIVWYEVFAGEKAFRQ